MARFYTYQCPEGHVNRHMVAQDDRDAAVPCKDCGAQASRSLTATVPMHPDAGLDEVRVAPNGVEIHVRNGKRWSGMVWAPFTCDACHYEQSIDLDFRAGDSNEGHLCPACGGPFRRVFTCNLVVDGYRYGEYDHGAGRTFDTPAERRKWMRANNVVEAGTDLPDAIATAGSRQVSASTAAFAEYRESVDYFRRAPDPGIRAAYAEAEKAIGDRSLTVSLDRGGESRDMVVPAAGLGPNG